MKDILDIKGLLMHSFFRCKGSGSPYRDADGNQVASAEAGFTTFLDTYLLPILDNAEPIDVIAVWEGGNIRRREIYSGYKEKRAARETDPVVEEQLDKLYNLTKSFLLGIGATNAVTDTVEADDTIAYLALNLQEPCAIYTIDADLMQLHDTEAEYPVNVFYRGEFAEDFELKVPPYLIAVNKALLGDKSDEYIGIKGFGQKAWEHLIDNFGEDGVLELAIMAETRKKADLVEAVEESGDAKLKLILDNFSTFCKMYQLAILHPEWCECTYKRKLIRPQWHRRLPNQERVEGVLEATGNEDLMDRIERYMPKLWLVSADNVDELLYDGDLLDDLNHRPVAFDYETYDIAKHPNFLLNNEDYVDTLSAMITGVSFTWGLNYSKTMYIPFRHRDGENNCSMQVLIDMLEEINDLVVHNSGFEEVVTRCNLPEQVASKLFGLKDTLVTSNYVNENEFRALKHRAKVHFNYTQTSYNELMAMYEAEDMSQLTSDQVCEYGADDSIVTAHLWHLHDMVMQLEHTRDFCHENEFITSSVFNSSFIAGCRIDMEQLERMSKRDGAARVVAEARLREILAEGCTEEDLEATELYMEEVQDFEIANMKDHGKTDEEISDKLQGIRERFQAGTKYVPYVEEVVPYKFIPTVTKFKDIFLTLDPDLDPDNEEEFLLTVAPTKISEQYLEKRGQWSPKVEPLMQLVLKAAHQFKGRAGDEYDELSAYVSELMSDKAKTKTTGFEMNFDSPVQTAVMLYGMLALPVRHYTKPYMGSARQELGFSGPPATDKKAIEIAMAEDAFEGTPEREALELIRKIKDIDTMFKFYYRPYPNWVHPDTGRIHPAVLNCTTTTRRPTGTSPNPLQVKKGLTRSLYLPIEDDQIIIAPDFHGQELRILASESMDEVLLDAFLGEELKDVHGLTASSILPKIAQALKPALFKQVVYEEGKRAQSYEQFVEWRKTDEFKEFANWVRDKRAKPCNFLVNYEGGASTLSTDMLVPKEDAQSFIDGMFDLYPGIPKFQKASHKIAAAQGYVTTAFGNRRHMTADIVHRNDMVRMRMERQASNFRIQGCAADILKVVIRKAYESGLLSDTQATILAPVYDELVNSVPIVNAVEFCQRLQKIMDLIPPGHAVPMMSEFAIGFDWYNMVEIGTDTSETTVKKAIKEARAKRDEFIAKEIRLDKEAA